MNGFVFNTEIDQFDVGYCGPRDMISIQRDVSREGSRRTVSIVDMDISDVTYRDHRDRRLVNISLEAPRIGRINPQYGLSVKTVSFSYYATPETFACAVSSMAENLDELIGIRFPTYFYTGVDQQVNPPFGILLGTNFSEPIAVLKQVLPLDDMFSLDFESPISLRLAAQIIGSSYKEWLGSIVGTIRYGSCIDEGRRGFDLYNDKDYLCTVSQTSIENRSRNSHVMLKLDLAKSPFYLSSTIARRLAKLVVASNNHLQKSSGSLRICT